jgi:hypothetical protein
MTKSLLVCCLKFQKSPSDEKQVRRAMKELHAANDEVKAARVQERAVAKKAMGSSGSLYEVC